MGRRGGGEGGGGGEGRGGRRKEEGGGREGKRGKRGEKERGECGGLCKRLSMCIGVVFNFAIQECSPIPGGSLFSGQILCVQRREGTRYPLIFGSYSLYEISKEDVIPYSAVNARDAPIRLFQS